MRFVRMKALVVAILIGFAPIAAPAQQADRAYIELLASYYAQFYGVPLDLVRRVINRESTFNPAARNGPYYGLMQILPATARTMGYRGSPEGLLDAETNLIYAVKYLRGAWLLADGSHDKAVRLYAAGYYYDAKARGMLEETGLRPGPNNPPHPPAAGQVMVAAAPAPAPTPAAAPEAAPQFTAPVVASLAPAAGPESVPLGFLPPSRPADLDAPVPATAALAAIEAAAPAPVPPVRPDPVISDLNASIQLASRFMASNEAGELRGSVDLFEGTFGLLDAIATPAQ